MNEEDLQLENVTDSIADVLATTYMSKRYYIQSSKEINQIYLVDRQDERRFLITVEWS